MRSVRICADAKEMREDGSEEEDRGHRVAGGDDCGDRW